MTTSEPTEQSPSAQTVRQGAALASGGIVILVAGVFLVAEIFDDNRDGLVPFLWPLAVILLAWAVFVRPCVRLRADGVELRNIVRDVVVTWSAIDLVESRWALTLVTEDGRDFKSFAVTAQRPKRGSGATSGKVLGSLAPADIGDLAHRRGSAGDVAQRINLVLEQYERGRKSGAVEAVETRAEVRPALTGIAAVVAGVALLVLAFVL